LREKSSPVIRIDIEPESDVWWGEDGIDALLWPKPYDEPPAEDADEASPLEGSR